MKDKNNSSKYQKIPSPGGGLFHLSDHVDMEEYQKQNKTNWWKRMSIPNPK